MINRDQQQPAGLGESRVKGLIYLLAQCTDGPTADVKSSTSEHANTTPSCSRPAALMPCPPSRLVVKVVHEAKGAVCLQQHRCTQWQVTSML